MIDHTNVCKLKRVVLGEGGEGRTRYYNNVRDVQSYFLNIVILSPSLNFGILQCSDLILPHRMDFYAGKTIKLGSTFSHPVTITFFFIPEGSLLLFRALAIFYFISFTYYMTHSNKSITVVPEFKNNKKATFDD